MSEQDRAEDQETGLSLRFIRAYDPVLDRWPTLAELAERHSWPIVFPPEYVGRLTDEGFYPSRVCSGRERDTE